MKGKEIVMKGSIFIMTFLVMGCSFFIESEEDVLSDATDSSESESDSIAWKLPDDYFVEAKMDMHLVFPRPADESEDETRYKWAHTGMEYEIPVGVLGGAWPFKYELIEGPEGAAIGEIYGNDDYGNISWDVPDTASGSYHFEVEVTDQEYNRITAEWDVEVDNDMFVFIEDGYTGTQVGTIDEPLEDFADWYLDDSTEDSYAGRIVVFREGNYALDGEDSDSAEKVRIVDDSKTKAFIGYPGETAILDGTEAKIFVGYGASTDFFVGNLTFQNADEGVTNSHFFWMTGASDRITFWNNTFDGMTEGTTGTDNPGAVFLSYTYSKENIYFKSNQFKNINNDSGDNGHYIDVYDAYYVLVEDNLAENCSTNTGFWLKAVISYITVRNNVAVNGVTGSQFETKMDNNQGEIPHDYELCWNRFMTSDEDSLNLILWAGNDDYINEHYNSFLYRNTFVYGEPKLRFVGAENYDSEDNIIISCDLDTYYLNEDSETITDNNGDLGFDSDEVTVSDIVDDEALLTGDYYVDYYGLKGAEVDMTQAVESDV